MNGSITSSGKPCGYVGIAFGVTMPHQLPVDRSSCPWPAGNARGKGGRRTGGSGQGLRRTAVQAARTFPSPRRLHRRQGRDHPRLAAAAMVCRGLCSSPRRRKSARIRASSPAPTASSTITHARGHAAILVAVTTVLGLLGLAVFICGVIRARGRFCHVRLVIRLFPAHELQGQARQAGPKRRCGSSQTRACERGPSSGVNSRLCARRRTASYRGPLPAEETFGRPLASAGSAANRRAQNRGRRSPPTLWQPFRVRERAIVEVIGTPARACSRRS